MQGAIPCSTIALTHYIQGLEDIMNTTIFQVSTVLDGWLRVTGKAILFVLTFTACVLMVTGYLFYEFGRLSGKVHYDYQNSDDTAHIETTAQPRSSDSPIKSTYNPTIEWEPVKPTVKAATNSGNTPLLRGAPEPIALIEGAKGVSESQHNTTGSTLLQKLESVATAAQDVLDTATELGLYKPVGLKVKGGYVDAHIAISGARLALSNLK